MKVRCPDCGSRGELSDELSGHMVRCPQCGSSFTAQPDLAATAGGNWYYALGNEKKGPVSEAEFDALVAAGTIVSDTLVWCKGMSGWQTLQEVRGEQDFVLAQEDQPRKMKVRCPECGRAGFLSIELTGQMVRCPQCGGQSLAKEDLGGEGTKKWYYALADQKKGPLGEAEFEQLIAAGTIGADTLVWCKGMGKWQSLAETRGADTVMMVGEQALPAQEEPGEVAPVPPETKPASEARPPGWASSLAYAGGGRRAVAKIIDFVFMFAWASLVEGLSRKLFPEAFEVAGTVNSVYVVTMLICLLLGMFYITWFVGRFGATPGKMVMNLKVVTATGGRVSYAQAFGRYWAEFVIVALTVVLGYLPVFFDRQRRGLHDRLCGTRVVVV